MSKNAVSVSVSGLTQSLRRWSMILTAVLGWQQLPAQPTQLIDTAEFEARPGDIFHFEGIFGGYSGVSITTFLDGSATIPGSIRADNILTSSAPDGNRSATTFSVNGAIVRQILNFPFGSMTKEYSPHWRLAPRFSRIGMNYTSTASYTGSIAGENIPIQGTITANGKIEAIETIDLRIGRFETLRIVVDLITTETFPGGWVQETAKVTAWMARDVGMVRYQSESSATGSNIPDQSLSTSYELTFTNRRITNLSVFPSENWFDGWVYVHFPWAYAAKSGRWVYLANDPWLAKTNTRTWNSLTGHNLRGWTYNLYPWLFSAEERAFFYGEGTWTFVDLLNQQSFVFGSN